MISKSKRILALGLSIFLAAASFAGCGKDNQSTPSTSAGTGSQSTSSSSEPAGTYPISGDNSLSVWMTMNPNVLAGAKEMGETHFAKELEKKTGVKIKYISPAAGADSERTAFSLMISGGDLPDIIESNWNTYQGGPEKAISDKVILKLNDIIDKHSPNFKAYLDGNPDVAKMAKTDNGTYFSYPFIRGDDALMVFQGAIIRQDILDELKLPMPETIDEWYTTLKTIKEKKNMIPLAFEGLPAREAFTKGFIAGAYGIVKGYYVDNGTVKFGPYEAGYKDFLMTLNKWYAEGLLDKNFASTDAKTLDALMAGGQAAASFGYNGGSLGAWQNAAKEKDPNIVFAGAPYPTLNKGEKPKFGQRDNAVSATYTPAITTGCKNVELAAKWLDYGYSEEGGLLYNFGIEGESYTMVNGYPTYTDLILKNPSKLSIGQAISQYARAAYSGPFVQRKEYIEQYLALQTQRDALKTWSNTDAAKTTMPPVAATPEESAELAKIMTEVNTHVDELTVKFIFGTESLSNYEKYVDQLKKLNIEKAISIYQGALERYNNR